MTPLEIVDYKNEWMPGKSVPVHSDKLDAAKTWCKNLERQTYHMTRWTDVYEHTFHFEDDSTAKEFNKTFNE